MRNPLLGMGYVNPSVAIIFQIGKIICVHPPHSHATCYNAGNPLRAQWLPLQGTPVARAGGTPLRVRPSGSPVPRARETRLQDWSGPVACGGKPSRSAGLTSRYNGGNPPSGSPVACGGRPSFSAGLTSCQGAGNPPTALVHRNALAQISRLYKDFGLVDFLNRAVLGLTQKITKVVVISSPLNHLSFSQEPHPGKATLHLPSPLAGRG